METTEMLYNDQALVIQANEIIRANQDDFTLLEAKLLKLTISQIAMQEKDFQTYTCKVKELAAFLNIPVDNIYRDIESTISSLMSKVITIKDKTRKPKRNGEYNYVKFHWVGFCRYNNGEITIRLSEEIKPFVLELNNHFTQYGLENIIGLPTSNSIRLFELLSSYESVVNTYSPGFTPSNPFPQIQKEDNELIFSVEYLRQYFNCADKYPLTADFIKRIIHPSAIGINKNTSMRTSYRTAKEGRSIAYILFKIDAWGDEDFREFIAKNCL